MRTVDIIAASIGSDVTVPAAFRDAVLRAAGGHAGPAEPAMNREDFAALPGYQRAILTCNMPGCGDVVSTHGMLCVRHGGEMATHRIPLGARDQAAPKRPGPGE